MTCGPVGDSERAKAVFLDALLRLGENTSSEAVDRLSSLRRVLPLCSRQCPVTICHGSKQHYVVCAPGASDPIVLENAEAVEQLTKQMFIDGEQVDEKLSWMTVHVASQLLQVKTLFCTIRGSGRPGQGVS